MKIAQVLGPLFVNGASRECLEHAWILSRLGHAVTVFAVEGPAPSWFEHPLEIRYFPRRGLADVLRPGEFDLVVANHHEGGMECLLVEAPKKVYAYRSYDPFLVAPQVRRHAFQLLNKHPYHLANSRVTADLVSLHARARIHVAPFGMNTAGLEEFRLSRAGSPRPAGPPRVGVMAAYPNKVKGLDLASAVFQELKKRLPDIQTVAVMDRRADLAHVDRMVTAPGFEEKLHAVADLDIFLHTSRFESLARAPLEAMALGVPVVATNSWGILEYANADNLVLVEPRSPRRIADAVQGLLGDPARCERLREAGIRTARACDWARQAAALEATYEAVIAGLDDDPRAAAGAPRRATRVPDAPRDLDRLGSMYLALGRLPLGLAIFQAIARDPANPDAVAAARQVARLRQASRRPRPEETR